MRKKHWDELDAMWALCAKTWAFWLGCIIVSALVGSLWSPARVPIIIVGFVAIGYFFARLIAFSWRWRGDGKHV